MKLIVSLRFAVLIVAMLCFAVAIRVFAAKKEQSGDTNPQFRLKIFPSARLNADDAAKPDDFYNKIKSGLDENATCAAYFPDDKKNKPISWCKENQKRFTSGAPHVQQTFQFTTAAGLKTFTDALASSTPTPTPTATPKPGGPPTGSPAPHVQQTAGVDSGESATAIAAALRQ